MEGEREEGEREGGTGRRRGEEEGGLWRVSV